MYNKVEHNTFYKSHLVGVNRATRAVGWEPLTRWKGATPPGQEGAT